MTYFFSTIFSPSIFHHTCHPLSFGLPFLLSFYTPTLRSLLILLFEPVHSYLLYTCFILTLLFQPPFILISYCSLLLYFYCSYFYFHYFPLMNQLLFSTIMFYFFFTILFIEVGFFCILILACNLIISFFVPFIQSIFLTTLMLVLNSHLILRRTHYLFHSVGALFLSSIHYIIGLKKHKDNIKNKCSSTTFFQCNTAKEQQQTNIFPQEGWRMKWLRYHSLFEVLSDLL